MKIKMKKMVGIILSFALVLGLIPGMGLTAYAADYETIEITNAVYDATSVSTLINSLDGFSKLSSEEAASWEPPIKSGNERLIYDYGEDNYGEFICVAMFNNGTHLSNAYISLAMATEYPDIKYYYAKKTVVAVNSVTLNKTSATLAVGGTETLTATVSPGDATDKTVTWSSDNTAVATVSNGVVTAVAEGTATITVTATNGTDDTSDDKTATCAVTVTENNGDTKQNAGDTQQNPDGTKTVTKEDADGKTIVITNYSKTDEQISQFVFKKANGKKLDLKNVNSKTLKKVIIPETVKANGNTYKVTRIRKGFLKNCKQATKVFISKYVNIIDKNAFKYGKKVKIVTIDGRLKKVGKGAFKNAKKNVVIKVKTSAKNFEKNKKLLEKSGLPTNATVKRVKNKK